jgi:DNA helicase-2/ATP-dependent DNA helicase PcrA
MRPLPQAPHNATQTGNRFHEWVEARYRAEGFATPVAGDRFAEVEPDSVVALEVLAELASDSEREAIEEQQLQVLREHFEQSRFPKLRPVAIEQELYLTLGDIIVVCKPDAVFEWEQGSFEIVDWKTGVPPEGEDEIADRFVQLELYRIAFAKLKGVPIGAVKITLCYLGEKGITEFSREDPASAAALLERWQEVRRQYFAPAE